MLRRRAAAGLVACRGCPAAYRRARRAGLAGTGRDDRAPYARARPILLAPARPIAAGRDNGAAHALPRRALHPGRMRRAADKQSRGKQRRGKQHRRKQRRREH